VTEEAKQPVFLLDTMSFIFRAYHAMQRSGPCLRAGAADGGDLRFCEHDQEAAAGLSRRSTLPPCST
jgi:5'-3' exonuclease